MNSAWLLVGSSALIGGVAGAVGAWYLQEDAPSRAVERPLPELASERDPALDPQLVSRLQALERSVRELESRRPSVASGGAGAPVSAGALAPTLVTPADPVFEAAVLDIIERAEEGRDSERDTRRDERARERAEAWANELTMRLGLSPTQTAKLAEIQAQLRDELRARRSNAAPGKFVPREQRRAAAQALRQRAEQELRELLDPSQAREYDKLDAELKIVRSEDGEQR
jgi:hypothetical protein